MSAVSLSVYEVVEIPWWRSLMRVARMAQAELEEWAGPEAVLVEVV